MISVVVGTIGNFVRSVVDVRIAVVVAVLS